MVGSEPKQRAPERVRRGIDALWRAAYRVAFRLQRIYWRIRRPVLRGSYVAVWHQGRVLCVRNSYRRRLTLPAGGLARGEEPRDAAVRELREEVSIATSPASLHYAGEIVSHVGPAEDRAHFFELHCEAQAPTFQVDRREVVWAGFLSPAEVLETEVVDVVRQYLGRLAKAASESPGSH